MTTLSDFFSSLLEAIKFRVTTSIVATYLFFWIAWHWQGFYTTIFVDQDLIAAKFNGMLKNEYLNQYFFGFQPYDPMFWFGYIIPAIATWLFIWVLPDILFLPAFKKERGYKLERKLVILKHERAYESEKAATAEQRAQRYEAEGKAAEAKRKAVKKNPNSTLSVEYNRFLRRPEGPKVLEDIRYCIYEQKGLTSRGAYSSTTGSEYRLNRDSLAIAHSNGLVEIDNSKANEKIDLTTKGRYFMSKFS